MINPCDIENELISKIKTSGYNTYNAVPVTVPTGNVPFFIVSAENKIVDMNAYYYTIVFIYIYVYNNAGFKNDKKIGIMIDELKKIFPFSSDIGNYDVCPDILPMGKSTSGYFINTIQLNTIIKK